MTLLSNLLDYPFTPTANVYFYPTSSTTIPTGASKMIIVAAGAGGSGGSGIGHIGGGGSGGVCGGVYDISPSAWEQPIVMAVAPYSSGPGGTTTVTCSALGLTLAAGGGQPGLGDPSHAGGAGGTASGGQQNRTGYAGVAGSDTTHGAGAGAPGILWFADGAPGRTSPSGQAGAGGGGVGAPGGAYELYAGSPAITSPTGGNVPGPGGPGFPAQGSGYYLIGPYYGAFGGGGGGGSNLCGCGGVYIMFT